MNTMMNMDSDLSRSNLIGCAPEELRATIRYMNRAFQYNEICKHQLPFRKDGSDVTAKLQDGLVLAAWIERIQPGLIDTTKLRIPKGVRPLNSFFISENNQVVYGALHELGVRLSDFNHGYAPNISIGCLLWLLELELIVSIGLCVSSLEDCKFEILKWANTHLRNARKPEIGNFASDLIDSESYLAIQHDLSPSRGSLIYLKTKSNLKRAMGVIRNGYRIRILPFVDPADILAGSYRLYLAFMAMHMKADVLLNEKKFLPAPCSGSKENENPASCKRSAKLDVHDSAPRYFLNRHYYSNDPSASHL